MLWLAACGSGSPPAAPVSATPSGPGLGQHPGPNVLHAAAAAVPQLQNAGVWRADPILVSGAWAYRDGEYLYQDFLYDDYGAAGVTDPNGFSNDTSFLGSPTAGSLRYPADPVFANNAADLVEFRVKPLPGATAFRITLNTLQDAGRTAFTIAIGDSAQLVEWPHGAGVRSPAALFLTVHGETAELREAETGTVRSPVPSVSVDLKRRQFDVRVPSAAWDPGTGTVRLAAGVGLWDTSAARYLAPQETATDTAPGGAAPSGAALFNIAFRFDEPMPDWGLMAAMNTFVELVALAEADGSWWRERAQADALASSDLSAFHAAVDFAKLNARIDDDSGIPRTGAINRILASRLSMGPGVDFSHGCGRPSAPPCVGPFVGELQPYALYVPEKVPPASGWGLTLLLHGWTINHNGYLGSRFQSQLGERGTGSLVATPLARGHDGAYVDMAEADVFEVWADIARHYPVDREWVAVAGHSMGGGGAYRLLTRWPDLFARGAIVGAAPEGFDALFPETSPSRLQSLRNNPLMVWIGALDEGTGFDRQEESVRRLGEAGLRFVFDQFPAAAHMTLPGNDEWGPLVEFLGEHRVTRNPARITHVVAPRQDSQRSEVVADHVYWLGDLRARHPEMIGTIDVHSEAFGVGQPEPGGVTSSFEVLEGGRQGPKPFHRRQQDWGPAPDAAAADRLVIKATNLAELTVDVLRARLSCQPQIDVTTDGPLLVQLEGCNRVIAFDGGS